MYKIYIYNSNNEGIEFNQKQNGYTIKKVTGLDPVTSTVSTSKYAMIDGSKLSSALVDKRNIVVDFNLYGSNADIRRRLMYSLFNTGDEVTVRYVCNAYDVYCTGVIETLETSRFETPVSCQISIICVDPFWHNYTEQEFEVDSLNKKFEFPFSIETTEPIEFSAIESKNEYDLQNAGLDTGFIAEIQCTGDVSYPALYNKSTKEILKLDGAYVLGDIITIDTRQLHKSIKLLRNGETTSIINQLRRNSTWLELHRGTNTFQLQASTGLTNMHVKIRYATKYAGV